MATTINITHEKLARLVGTPKAPLVVDVLTDKDFAADTRILPGALRWGHPDVAAWARDLTGRTAVVVCQKGAKLSHGVAAWFATRASPPRCWRAGTRHEQRPACRSSRRRSCRAAMGEAAPSG